jgi:hypothetical protein
MLAQETQPISIFGDTVPDNPVATDFSAVTLGVKFWSSQSGTIAAIRFDRGAVSPGAYVAGLCAADGTRFGSAYMAQESGPYRAGRRLILRPPFRFRQIRPMLPLITLLPASMPTRIMA